MIKVDFNDRFVKLRSAVFLAAIKARCFALHVVAFLLVTALLSCTDHHSTTRENGTKQTYVDLYASIRQSAVVSGRVLELVCIIHNTTQQDVVIMPTLLYTQFADKRLWSLRRDVVAAELSGCIDSWNRAGMGENMMGFDRRYQFQLVMLKSGDTITLEYKIPLTLKQTKAFRRVKLLEPLKIPAWSVASMTKIGLKENVQVLDHMLLDQIHSPNTSGFFYDPHIVNIGSNGWSKAFVCDSSLYNQLVRTKQGWVLDTTYMSISVSRKNN